jgi:hypothetical protein
MSEFNINEEVKVKEKIIYVAFALLLGVVFDRMFVGNSIGISYPIFTSLTIGFFILSSKKIIDRKFNMGFVFLSLAILLSVYFAVGTNVIIRTLNIFAVPVLLISASLIITKTEVKWSAPGFIAKVLDRGILHPLENFDKPVTFTSEAIKEMTNSKLSQGKKQVIKGLLISIPILIVVLILLSSADMVFNYYIQNFSKIFDDIDINEIFKHAIVILLITFYLFGYIWSFKVNKAKKVVIEKDKNFWEVITNITVIALIDIVYLLFTIIQFSYLYGGGETNLQKGFTYADYARRGFFELVTVAIINYILVMLSSKSIRKSTGAMSYAIKILVTLLVLFTMNMIFSAHYKLSLYESSYGFTYLRVYVHMFMAILFLLCFFAAISIWTDKMSLAKSLIITLVLGYTIISYVNVDAFIAKRNIERYRTAKKIDIYYLTNLSYEALPYLVELKDDSDFNISNTVRKDLIRRKETLEEEKGLFQFNFSKERARKLLRTLEL